MIVTITGNRKFKCPHCGVMMDYRIGDYVIPGRIGPTSISRSYGDCGECDGIFSVERTADITYKLTPVQGRYGDTRP